MRDETMEKLLTRCILKSLNKHILSDISVGSRDRMRELDTKIWSHLINESAKQISSNFPRVISKEVNKYLTFEGDYEISDPNVTKEVIEDLIKYCQYKTALEECLTNMPAFNSKKYETIKKSLIDKINSIPSDRLNIFNKTYDMLIDAEYFETIKQLKNLRRWNRVIRSNESTVMGHTFVVSIIAIVFANIESQRNVGPANLKYGSLLKALFHDLPESLTGDVITPVKDIINMKKKGFWSEVEKSLVNDFMSCLPPKLLMDFEKYSLLNDFNDDLFSFDSLVKTSDQLALIFECLYEREWGSNIDEMQRAYEAYTSKLQNSEWESIREYAHSLLIDFPK